MEAETSSELFRDRIKPNGRTVKSEFSACSSSDDEWLGNTMQNLEDSTFSKSG